MDTNIFWKGEIIFRGDAKEYTQLAAAFEKLPVEINIPEWRRPHHLAGCFPFPVESLLGRDLLDNIIDGMPRVPVKFIKGIPGGIRPAHLHIGNEIVLLDRNRFRTYASAVAAEMAKILVDTEGLDYVDVMGPINELTQGPNIG
jgi:hypothetical protein